LKDETASAQVRLKTHASEEQIVSRNPPAAGLVLGVLLLAGAPLAAQDKDPLREKLKDSAVDAAWVYDDIDKGFAEAKRTGKPMLVVFR
jgi:hypothetical protein